MGERPCGASDSEYCPHPKFPCSECPYLDTLRGTDMSHAFHLLGVDCRADSEFWFPELHQDDARHLATHYALGLAGEVGELLNMIKKANRRSCKAGMQGLMFENDYEEVQGEFADVFIYLVDLAHEIGINLWDAYEAKHETLEERWGKRGVGQPSGA